MPDESPPLQADLGHRIRAPIWLLIAIPLLLATLNLSNSVSHDPIEESFTRQAHAAVTAHILSQTREQLPQLNDAEIERAAQSAIRAALASETTKQKIADAVAEQRRMFSDPFGQSHLNEPDAYLFLRQAENILDHGHPGETLREGKPFDTLRSPPQGEPVQWSLLPLIEAWAYKLSKTVFPTTTTLKTAFYLPVLLGLISTALIFAIATTIRSREAGFFAATLFALHPEILRQNMAGYADLPALVMPLSLAFFLSLFLAVETRNRTRLAWIVAALAALALLSFTWTGWFFVLAVIGITSLFATATFAIAHRRTILSSWKTLALATAALICTAILFVSQGYLQRVLVKLGLRGASSAVQSTVVELVAPTTDSIVGVLGGPLFTLLLTISVALACGRLLRKNTLLCDILLISWFLVLLFPTFRGLRYAYFLVPPATFLIALLLDTCLPHVAAFIWELNVCSKRNATFAAIFLLPLAVGIPLIDTHSTNLPVVNQAITQASQWITENATGTLLNTWWDRGYIWEYTTRQPTVLDAGPSNRSFWMAKALISTDPDYSLGALRMLDCSGLQAYAPIRQKTSVRAPKLLDSLLRDNRAQASETLTKEGLGHLINHTHCDPPPSLIIADQHSFEVVRTIAAIAAYDHEAELAHTLTIGLPHEDAILALEAKNITREKAEDLLAGHAPSFAPRGNISAIEQCDRIDNSTLSCGAYVVNTESVNATRKDKHPARLVLIDSKRNERHYPSGGAYTLVVFRHGENFRSFLISPELADSLLVRLFIGDPPSGFIPAYETQSPERIVTYRINWTTQRNES